MKLSEIQQKLKAPKNQYNAFGKYNYRSCEDILEAVKPLLGDSILTLSDEVVNVGTRNYVKAKASLWNGKDGDESREWSVTAFACEAEDRKGMDASQITGAASSYARKYALNGLFLIDDTKDADHDERPKPEKPKPEKDETLEQKTRIAALLRELGIPFTKETAAEVVYRTVKVQLEPQNFADIIERLEALKDEKSE